MTSANDLFRVGDYTGALRAYSSCLAGGSDAAAEDTAVLLSNRAACHLRLGDATAAAADCITALTIDPCRPKTQLRLAKALPVESRDAAAAICAAVALTTGTLPSELAALYDDIQRVHDWMPVDCNRVFCLTSVAGVVDGIVGVLRPGRYRADVSSNLSYALIGLGTVELYSTYSHAMFVQASVTVINARLIGSGRQAAVCVCGRAARLLLHRCRVIEYAECGILAAEHCHLELDTCQFRRTGKQAIEIREDAQLVAIRVEIDNCLQGVSAYGGARSVALQHCSIRNCVKEGIYLSGTFENAATAMQRDLLPVPAGDPTVSQRVSDRANEWGKKRGIQLDLTMSDTVVIGCGVFGVSVDHGARAVIHRCRFERNVPVSIFVKGCSDMCVSASQFIYTGAISHAWAKGPMKQAAVCVGVNYAGAVDVVGCAFAGPEHLAVFQENPAISDMSTYRMMGLWYSYSLRYCQLSHADRPSIQVDTGEYAR